MALSPLNRRDALKLFGLTAAGGALAACAPSGGTATSGDASASDFTFTAWSLNEAATKDVLTSLVDTYAGAAGSKINKASYPYADYLNQVLLQLRGGTLSGVVQLDVAWLATLAATGKLLDLGPLAAKGGYSPAALDIAKVGGKQVGLPWTTAGIGLIGNKDLLGKAGIDQAPKTVGDFEDALRALKDLGGGVVPWAAMTKVDQLKDFIPWMWTFGSPVVAEGKITVGDEASVEALVWYKKLYDQKLIAPDVNRFDARALFGQGKVGFYEDAIGGRAAVTSTSPDKELGSKLMPVSRPVLKAGDASRHLAWGHALAVVQGTGSDAAQKFVSTLTADPAYQGKWFKGAGLPPTTTAGLAGADVKGDPFVTAFTSAIGAHASADPFWVYPKFAQIETVLATAVQSALVGKASPKDALASAKSQMDALTS